MDYARQRLFSLRTCPSLLHSHLHLYTTPSQVMFGRHHALVFVSVIIGSCVQLGCCALIASSKLQHCVQGGPQDEPADCVQKLVVAVTVENNQVCDGSLQPLYLNLYAFGCLGHNPHFWPVCFTCSDPQPTTQMKILRRPEQKGSPSWDPLWSQSVYTIG